MPEKAFHRDLPYNDLPALPPEVNLETPEIFRATIWANKLLAELKGFCLTLPNPELLLNTIVLQESKESSAIESKYIIENKPDYYRLLREVTEQNNWKDWVLYVVNGVAETSATTLGKIKRILALKSEAEADLKSKLGSSFSRELNDLLFSYPYIKIAVLEEHGIAKRQTGSRYLKTIEKAGWLRSMQVWKETYYVNHKLIDVLSS